MNYLRASLCALTLIAPALVQAAPWASPGDQQLRSSLEWLSDRNCLAAPITTWPIMWAAVTLKDTENQQCSNSSAWHYVSFERNWAQRTSSAQLRFAGSSDTPVIRGFNNQPREKGEITAQLEAHSDHLAIGISPSWVHSPYGLDRHKQRDHWRLDGSYLAASLGNWTMGAGALDRWWGPGHSTSLILSNNSRPVPGVFINRLNSQPFNFPVLRWLGPWSVSAFAGQLESDRAVSHAKLLGARFTLKPASWLELGASRTAQWGGEGRTQSLRSLGNLMIGRDNYREENDKEPGNQVAGFDFRIGLPVGQTSAFSFYGQFIGEDEAGYLPSKNIAQFGTSLAGHWLAGRQQLWLEYTDTTVDKLAGRAKPNVAYEHKIYNSGYRYYGRSLGSTWDTDSQVTSLGINQFFENGNNIGLTIDHVKLNSDGTLGRSASNQPTPVLAQPDSENLTHLRLHYQQPIFNGRLTLSTDWTDQTLYSLQHDFNQFTVMASWEYRFAP